MMLVKNFPFYEAALSCLPPQLRPKDGQRKRACAVERGILDFAEAQAGSEKQGQNISSLWC